MNIIELAREAGITQAVSRDPTLGTFALLERFAALVRAAALDEAAGVCDAKSMVDFPQTKTGLGFVFSQQRRWDAARAAEKQCAAAIRQLKENK